MNKRVLVTGLSALALVAGLSGCSVKQVDPVATGAVPVPGTGNLWTFCYGDTQIFYSNYGSTANDEYEFIVYGGCAEEVPSQDGVQNLPDDTDE